jgi:hypothetical protein
MVTLSEEHSLTAILLFIPKRFSRFPGFREVHKPTVSSEGFILYFILGITNY